MLSAALKKGNFVSRPWLFAEAAAFRNEGVFRRRRRESEGVVTPLLAASAEGSASGSGTIRGSSSRWPKRYSPMGMPRRRALATSLLARFWRNEQMGSINRMCEKFILCVVGIRYLVRDVEHELCEKIDHRRSAAIIQQWWAADT